MGKPNGMKNSNHVNGNPGGENSPEAFDKDTEVSVSTSRLKDEGNKLFQRRDHEGAMSKYAEALELLPRDHADVPYLRSNVAACYMQMGLSEYPRAIRECGLALEVAPKYGKALLKRARCYEALNRLDLALRDVSSVLSDEPNNVMALEISERVRAMLEKKGLKVNNSDGIELPHDYVEPQSSLTKVGKDKNRKKKKKKKSNKASLDIAVEEKVVMEEKVSTINEVPKRNVKLILGEDIRWALLAENCSLMELREVVFDRFPSSRGVAIKYRDHEGDLVTITSDEELRLAEESSESQGSIRFYIVEVDPEKDPFLFGKVKSEDDLNKLSFGESSVVAEIMPVSCVEDWVIQFAHVFKNHVGFESDSYLNIHEIGMKLYSEAMEETVTSDEAQEIFDTAGDKFQELAALALFNWGNVHMSRARKKVDFGENDSNDLVMARIKSAYNWAQEEYLKAGMRYEESIKMKPDFYEGYLALGKQRFERAKLTWCYNVSNNHESESADSAQIMKLYNDAEVNMEKGMRMWEEKEERRVREVADLNGVGTKIRDMGLDGFFNDVSAGEAAELASNVRSQINLLWGTMLYERSIVEFKLGLPVWQECLEVAIEKFELAGASQTDIGVMVKNHCSNGTALEGLGFKIDEIVQAWNEMYEAKKLQSGVPSFRLEPLLRRRVSKLYHALEDA